MTKPVTPASTCPSTLCPRRRTTWACHPARSEAGQGLCGATGWSAPRNGCAGAQRRGCCIRPVRPVRHARRGHCAGRHPPDWRPHAADPAGVARAPAEIGLEHTLASSRLYSDGAEVLFDLAEANEGSPAAGVAKELVVIRSGQRVFTEVVSDYLTRIEYGADGYASLIHLPGYRTREVVADPQRSFGQPIFVNGGARVADVIDQFQAGESLNDLADDFGVPATDLRGRAPCRIPPGCLTSSLTAAWAASRSLRSCSRRPSTRHTCGALRHPGR